MSQIILSFFFLISIHSYCKYSWKEKKEKRQHSEVDRFFREILQSLAAQIVAVGPANHTVQPRTTILKSPPIVRPIQFWKRAGFDHLKWASKLLSEMRPLSCYCKSIISLSAAAMVARDLSPPKCLLKEAVLEGCLSLKRQRKWTSEKTLRACSWKTRPAFEQEGDRNNHLHQIHNKRTFKCDSPLAMPI